MHHFNSATSQTESHGPDGSSPGQFIKSSTFEITNSVVFDKPSSDPCVEGGGGLEYGDGEENDCDRVERVVWIEAAATRE
nr:hypothetical protein [Tanacetum cinerariifolium]